MDLRVDASAGADPAVLAQAKEVCVLYYTCVLDAEHAATATTIFFFFPLFFQVLQFPSALLPRPPIFPLFFFI